MIRFEEIDFTYPGASGGRPALSGVSLELAEGEIVAVLGANGSGKSTLVRLANGILAPDAGSVTVDGAVPGGTDRRTPADGSAPPADARGAVGVVFQHPDDQIVATSVEDDVAFGPENLGCPRDEIRRRVDESLALVGLTGLEHREPHLLSGGQKQRLAIAGALAMHPRYLVLDEPTSMLDPAGRAEVLAVVSALRHEGKGVLLVTHDLAEAARADRVIVLDAGEVAFRGTPSELFGSERLAEWGLEPPAVTGLVVALRERGVPVAVDEVDPERIAGALCR